MSEFITVNEKRSTIPGCLLTVAITTDELSSHLDVQNLTVEDCPDVYRALARIPRIKPAAVIVNTDWLTQAEFEFFELMKRIHREIPVFVIGSERCASKTDQALTCGAWAVANDSRIERVMVSHAETQSKSPTLPDDINNDTMPELSDYGDFGVTNEEWSEEDFGSEESPLSEDRFAKADNELDTELEQRLLDGLPSEDEHRDRFHDSIQTPDTNNDEIPHDVVTPTDVDMPELEDDLDNEWPLEKEEAEDSPEDSNQPLLKDVGKETNGNTARVPWMRYGSNPTRIPPARKGPERIQPPRDQESQVESPESIQNQPAADTPVEDEAETELPQPPTVEFSDPPLLTKQELDALLGNDVDSNNTQLEQ